ncbi:MAG: 4Fe-4S binding protein [Candidatus Hydrothermarchaeales archaeon]
MLQLEVDEEKCNGDGVCRKVCPKGPRIWRIEDTKQGRKAVILDPSFCLLCGMCVTRCPTNAIKIQIDSGDYISILGGV